eukprot:221475-Chlamydomonas_euryale.AAC.6
MQEDCCRLRQWLKCVNYSSYHLKVEKLLTDATCPCCERSVTPCKVAGHANFPRWFSRGLLVDYAYDEATKSHHTAQWQAVAHAAGS